MITVLSQPGQEVVRPHLNQELGTTVHACHPKAWKKLRFENCSSSVARGKMFVRPDLNDRKLGVVAVPIIPVTTGKPKLGGPWSRLT
jgi:hypothetical protein